MAAVVFLWAVLGIGGFVLWVWALFDCLTRKDEDFPGHGTNEKIIWILIIVLASFVGSLLYLFMVKLNSPKRNTIE
ncbi:MAG: PLD nuclease N-terminal domain-containing protein [Dehalococcoidales bacterium]|nr:PLD nuclease N-terminal domain-containing protein [Dehalococcoidales bacterium]